eukprot:snap_masked-scaffold_1-processed-gene-22.31-mRNA-1 protein AED:0.40 eAED:0.40 QI:0/-1/0/1/-1/1/1/0/402
MFINLDDIRSKAIIWKECFPRIKPFFAVKANDHARVISTLKEFSFGFNCGSQREIKKVLDQGVNVDDILYANPIKQKKEFAFAETSGVSFTVFDNIDELKKIFSLSKNLSGLKLLLRLKTDDSKSVCTLSEKFGAEKSEIGEMLLYIKENRVEQSFVGFSFHAGSGCESGLSFLKALVEAKEHFAMARAHGFFQDKGKKPLLNIGGGFSGKNLEDFKCSLKECPGKSLDELKTFILQKKEEYGKLRFIDLVSVVSVAVDLLYGNRYEIIAEPGRFFVDTAGTLASKVIARRVPREAEDVYRYYMDEGVYGGLNNLIYDHSDVFAKVLRCKADSTNEKHIESSLWGPTCDGLDCISKKVNLHVLQLDDWLYFENMGAYTMCAASTFNGFEKAKIFTKDDISVL